MRFLSHAVSVAFLLPMLESTSFATPVDPDLPANPNLFANLTNEEIRFVSRLDPDTYVMYQLFQANSVQEFMNDYRDTSKISSSKSSGKKGAKSSDEKQVVFLQFDPIVPTYPIDIFTTGGSFCGREFVPRRLYTDYQKEEIINRFKRDYQEFYFTFVTKQPHPMEGAYSTIRFFYEFPFFNVYARRSRHTARVNQCGDDPFAQFVSYSTGILGGVAENIDFLNTNKAEIGVLDTLDHINTELLFDPTASGLEKYLNIPRKSTDGETIQEYIDRLVINGASNIGAHELGHISGLRHHDAFGPIGDGGLCYLSIFGSDCGDFSLPTDFQEYIQHVMATPALGGLPALTNFYSKDAFFSERSATKLFLSLNGVPVSEEDLKKENAKGNDIKLETLNVPSTLLSGDNDGSENFKIDAIIFYGTLESPTEVDSFRFHLDKGTYFNMEVISIADNKFTNKIDALVEIFYVESDGSLTFVALPDDDLEIFDSWVVNLPITKSGTYEIRIWEWFHYLGFPFFTGDYVAYIHAGEFPLQDGGKGGKSGKSSRRRHLRSKQHIKGSSKRGKNKAAPHTVARGNGDW